jgi:hypothetical protein
MRKGLQFRGIPRKFRVLKSLTPLYTKLAISKIENLRESEALIKKAQGKFFDGKKKVKNLVSGSF